MFFRKLNLGLVFIIVMLIMTSCAQSEHEIRTAAVPNVETSKQIERFSQLADEVYTKTLKGEFQEARQQIIQLGELLPKMRLDGVTSLQGVSALADTLLQAYRVFNAARLDPEQANFASTRIRLMADALSHPNTPMWFQFNKLFQEDLEQMEKATKQQQIKDIQKTFADLNTHYTTIQPALQVSIQEEELSKMDSALQYLKNTLLAEPIKYSNIIHALKTLREQFDNLFQLNSETTAYLPFMDSNASLFTWIFSIGAIIILVLTFVAWRMRIARDGIITIRR
jgi:sporulation protein YpjB